MPTVSVLNADSNLSGKTLITKENDYTITGQMTYDRDPSAPFVVSAGSAVVANLDADLLDGQHGQYYKDLTRWTQVTITNTGTVNDFAPGFTSNQPLIVICGNASLLTITGVAGGTTGQQLLFLASGSQVDFVHNSGASSAGNRFGNIATSGNTSMTVRGYAHFIYGGSGWNLVGHDQGADLAATFAAGDFTGSVSMTWTVASGDVLSLRRRLIGNTLIVKIAIKTTTVGGTPSIYLQIGNGQWGGFTVASHLKTNPCLILDNSVRSIGYLDVASGGLIIRVNRADGGNWSAATDTTYVFGELAFEVS